MEIVTVSNVCYILSCTVIASNFIVKVPQILRIFQSRSTKGLSLSSVLPEETGYSIILAYNYAMQYPLSTYFEYTMLVLQDLILIIAILHFDNILGIKILPAFVIYVLPFYALGSRWFPEFILKISITLVTPLAFISKFAQIKILYKQKTPGQVSLTSWMIATYRILDLILIAAILHFNNILNIRVLLAFVFYIITYCGLGLRWFPEFILKLSISLVTPLAFISKSAQIKILYKQKSPGQVSLSTWMIGTYGATARLITSTLLTGDLAMMANFTVAASMNLTIVCMILYYGRQRRKEKVN